MFSSCSLHKKKKEKMSPGQRHLRTFPAEDKELKMNSNLGFEPSETEGKRISSIFFFAQLNFKAAEVSTPCSSPHKTLQDPIAREINVKCFILFSVYLAFNSHHSL